MFDSAPPGADYELVWPRELFRSEAQALLAYEGPDWSDRAEFLLGEAFAGDGPKEDFRAASWKDFPALMSASWAGDGQQTQRAFIQRLVESVEVLAEHAAPRPYWADRQRRSESTPPRVDRMERKEQLKREWVALVNEFRKQGYLERVAPKACVDDRDPPPVVEIVLDGLTEERIGVAGLWPLKPSDWDDDTFYSLVEVVHDLVARPRSRYFHDYASCGLHYSSFSVEPGQVLYRWRVNRLLARHGTGLQLAHDGEDRGRLIHAPSDGRQQLVEHVLTVTDADSRPTVEHAVALFRARNAGIPEKRSAVVALAGLLEERRVLLRAELLSTDEAALFSIANNYGLRHRRADQRTDYDEVFLDWVFWWYLATIELVNRLLTRQAESI